uniref:Uncharacterized protein n=1 Tax=Anguilla anguilla TaxID=7936 RepID=A0A0E9Q5C9_ANGAN
MIRKASAGLLCSTPVSAPASLPLISIVTHFCGQSTAEFNVSIPPVLFCMTNCLINIYRVIIK